MILQQSEKGFGAGKNVGWIFVQKTMQVDLVLYKVLHMTFELTRI